MLPTNVNTASDLMSIALRAEREAIRRYTQLANSMREGNNESAAALFERMVIEEEEHERLLLEWMAQEGIDENPNIEPVSWRDPSISTTYNDEARDPYYSSPYKACAFAVHNEEIAFSFYTHVAANSENEVVRQYAEILAREELGHAALLRAERRNAYHAERDANSSEPRLNPKAVHNEADLLAAAIHIDQYLVEQMKAISSTTPEINSLAEETQKHIDENEHALEGKDTPSEDITTNIKQLKSYNSSANQKTKNENIEVHQLWACCDRSFAFYDAVVETAIDEEVMLAAQKLTSSALDRIGVLKDVLIEE